MHSSALGRRGAAMALWAALAGLLFIGCQKKAPPAPATPPPTRLSVAAAASTRFAMPEIIAEFEKANQGVTVEAVYGASGTLTSQIASKAPLDVFLSADENYPIELIKNGHGVGGSIMRYATGRLALWVFKDSPLDVSKGYSALAHESVKKIAIANPKLAPYGVAAEEAMKKAGVYDGVKDKLVLGENIAQTAQFVESGAAQAGFIALSMVFAPEMKDKGRWWEVPAIDHSQIIQSGCVSAYAKNRALAEKFLAFMQSEAARAALKRHGFGIPGE
jgi:molybdate transport system substrate-binding protein